MKLVILTILLTITSLILEAIGISLKYDTLIFLTLEIAFGVLFYILYIFATFKDKPND